MVSPVLERTFIMWSKMINLKKCEYCKGQGGRSTRRSWWEDCHHCYGTTYAWRWIIILMLFYWRHFKTSHYPQFGEFDQFNPMLYPPYLWTCRTCNGMGCDLYGYESCESCDGSGLRWQWMNPIRKAWRWIIKPYQNWRYNRQMNKPLSNDEIPF